MANHNGAVPEYCDAANIFPFKHESPSMTVPFIVGENRDTTGGEHLHHHRRARPWQTRHEKQRLLGEGA